MDIVVTGASGYVGEAVTAHLVQAGHHVRAVARHRPDRSPSAVDWVLGDIRQMDLVEPFRGADAVVHLVGIIREIPQSGITFEAMHVRVTERVLAAMSQAGVSRLIHMSALGTRPGASSAYHRTKWQAEELVRGVQSHLNAVIVRPSLLFGGAPPFFATLDSLAKLPWVPVPGDGLTVFQPVYREDVAQLFAALVSDSSRDLTLELGGPDRLTLNQLIDFMASRHGRGHAAKLHLPLAMVGAVASLSRLIPVPITPDQLQMLTEPNTTDDERWHRWVPNPTRLFDWHPEY